MNDRNLQYFLTVANERSISSAAKKLFISQPSLSQAIKRLEDHVGAPLFKRTQSGLALTNAGQQFYTAAAQTEKIWQDFSLNMNAPDHLKVGTLSFGITTQLGLKILPPLLIAFHRQFPRIDCNIEDIRHRELEQKLLLGEIDLAITHIYPHTERPNISYESFLRDPFVVITSPDIDLSKIPGMLTDNPNGPEINLRMLKDQKLILPRRDNQTRRIIDHALAQADIPNPAELFLNHQFQTIQALAAAGLGIGMVPLSYITPAIKVNLYKIPAEYHAYWELCIATKRNYSPNYIENHFAQLAKKICREVLC